ncbi:MAG: response regulator [Actinomycetota bacterium]
MLPDLGSPERREPAHMQAELLELFSQEAGSRLERLAADLLALEAGGDTVAIVASMFREAHNLKGAAAMMGFTDVTDVAHAIEDVLDQLRGGTREIDEATADGLLAAFDWLADVIPRTVVGEDISSGAGQIAARLRSPAPALESPAAAHPPASASPLRSTAQKISASVPASGGGDSLRVPLARLDELTRLTGEASTARLRVGGLVTEHLGTDPDAMEEFRDLGRALAGLQDETMRARMVPVSTIVGVLHRAARDAARRCGKPVRWEVDGDETELDRRILEHLADPLLHLVRNAVDHGLESAAERRAAGKVPEGTVSLHAAEMGSEVVVTVSDDGGGIDVDRVREEASANDPRALDLSDEEALYLVFRSGLSTSEQTTDVSGRGVGLDVVRTQLEQVRGRVEISSRPGVGTEFRISVPLTLSVVPSLLVAAGGQRFAIPMRSVLTTIGAGEPRSHAGGRPHVWVNGRIVPESRLAADLGIAQEDGEARPAVVVAGVTRLHAFGVDGLLGQRDVVVKPLGRLVPSIGVVAGASIEPDGSILLVLNASGLVDEARQVSGHAVRRGEPAIVPVDALGTILVVDDALTVRELERSILERAGYEVHTASDGADALARLGERPVDLVLTDIEMPNLDGFGLIEAIRRHESLSTVPVVILTTRSDDASRRRGLDAGADGYVVKNDFDGATLVATVERLLGRSS